MYVEGMYYFSLIKLIAFYVLAIRNYQVDMGELNQMLSVTVLECEDLASSMCIYIHVE